MRHFLQTMQGKQLERVARAEGGGEVVDRQTDRQTSNLQTMQKSLKHYIIYSYEGHLLCFAIWFFNNTYSHSVYSSFSKKAPSACTHLTILSKQLSMTPNRVDWGMLKMTPSKNARASSAFWNCFPFSCLLTEGNRNQSQGANSGECGGWMTGWTSLAARMSRVTAAVCALALSWWSSRPRTPVRGRRLHHAWKTLGKQWLTYQLSVTVFVSSSGMVATWPKLQRNTLSFVWKHFCFFWI